MNKTPSWPVLLRQLGHPCRIRSFASAGYPACAFSCLVKVYLMVRRNNKLDSTGRGLVLEPTRREWSEVEGGAAAQNELGHKLGGDGGEQNAVAEVAGGDVEPAN